jgi:hypothetical protein
MAALWVSRDGDRWDNVFELPKDGLSATYFQFGSLVLPRGHSDHQRITVSGQALEELDGLTLSGRLAG